MSRFDPYHLYSRQQRNTHTGQVIRKKPYFNYSPALSPEDFESAEKLLENQGYRVYPPGRLPFRYFETFQITHDLGELPYNFPTTLNPYSINVSQIWHNYLLPTLDFGPLPEQIEHFYLSISLNSFSAWQYTPIETGSRRYAFVIYLQDPTGQAANQIGDGTRQILASSAYDRAGFSVSPNTVDTFLFSSLFSSSTRDGFYTQPRGTDFGLSSTYITAIHTTSVADYARLRSNDEAFINNLPPLLLWKPLISATGDPEQAPIGRLHHHLCKFTVTMSYDVNY